MIPDAHRSGPTPAAMTTALLSPRPVVQHFPGPHDQPYMFCTETGLRVVSLDGLGNYTIHLPSLAYAELLVQALQDALPWLREDERGAAS